MTPYDLPMWAAAPMLFVLGAVLGSFLNVCIHRIPQHERFVDQLWSLLSPPSHCPGCHMEIPRGDNIPILGWLKLGGRCRFCRMRISPRYPLIELLNGCLFAGVYLLEVPAGFQATLSEGGVYAVLGPQIIPEGLSPTAWLNWRYVYHMVLIESLLVATFIDLDRMIIPDGCTLPAMLIGVVGGWLLGQVFLVPVWFQEPSLARVVFDGMQGWFGPMTVPDVNWAQSDMGRQLGRLEIPAWLRAHPHGHGLAVSLAGMIVGGGSVWALRLIGAFVLKREAMGFGDVVLMATIGSFLGWQPTLVVFFVAPFVAMAVWVLTVVFIRRRVIPYGPYLSIATLIVLFAWKDIWPVAQWWFAWGPLILPAGAFMAVGMFLSLQLVQLGKRLLGMPLYELEPQDRVIEQWTPADQLAYLHGEAVDRRQGRWVTDHEWPGIAAGRGQLHEERWRQ